MNILTSLLVVGLVVAWLVVLVPMVSRSRARVPQMRYEGEGHRVLARDGRSVSARRRTRVAGAVPSAAVGSFNSVRGDRSMREEAVPVSVGSGFDQQHPADAAEEWQAAQAEAARRRTPEPEVTQDEQEQPQGRFARFGRIRRGSHPAAPAELETGLDEAPEAAPDMYEDADAEQWGGDDEQRPETDEHVADEQMRPIPRRAGRGGFDPDAAAVAQAFRYSRRRRVAFTLLIATVALAAIALILTPVAWIGSALAGVLLVGYLVYLRRQVRIEDAVRQRRMARLQRARQIRPEHTAGARTDLGPIPGPASPVNLHRTRQIVAVDDDDPAFDDLVHYEPIEYRRAVGQ
ncbi:hypothetical protein JL107_07110 [Nakamurella flavida]|uniref:Transmembrane protein n=1 Tax=Nakamurella flavida TaxID=363630 RepID=A0A938YN06_9ACTN|nr:gephyrin-like molybdotransferase receptor GlpR [Nakamurella flavida]MBM9476209.1 hypothetical protein [Nakamurella flavida]MDP9779693.1 hypothetical protein [Nakamurella flavida]